MSIDILKTVAVQGTQKLCDDNKINQSLPTLGDEHEIELNMKHAIVDMKTFYKAKAAPLASNLMDAGMGEDTAWNMAFDYVRDK